MLRRLDTANHEARTLKDQAVEAQSRLQAHERNMREELQRQQDELKRAADQQKQTEFELEEVRSKLTEAAERQRAALQAADDERCKLEAQRAESKQVPVSVLGWFERVMDVCRRRVHHRRPRQQAVIQWLDGAGALRRRHSTPRTAS